MSVKSDYHVDKYAIEIICPLGRIRFMEMFGDKAAKATGEIVKKYQDAHNQRTVVVIQIQDENGPI